MLFLLLVLMMHALVLPHAALGHFLFAARGDFVVIGSQASELTTFARRDVGAELFKIGLTGLLKFFPLFFKPLLAFGHVVLAALGKLRLMGLHAVGNSAAPWLNISTQLFDVFPAGAVFVRQNRPCNTG